MNAPGECDHGSPPNPTSATAYVHNPHTWTDPLGLENNYAPGQNNKGTTPSGATDRDGNSIAQQVSRQKQARHVKGTPEFANRNGGTGSYFKSQGDAQKALDQAHNGQAKLLGYNKAGQPVYRSPDVIGYNNNPGKSFYNQPTDVFFVKGTKSPSVVPTSPNWR